MLDLTALVVSQRLMDEQFSEQVASRTAHTESARKPLRARAARALRSVANTLEPTPERQTAR